MNITGDHLVSRSDARSKSGKMKRMKQWGHFNYEEGERHGTGETAYLENDTNIMDIDKNARVWDDEGSRECSGVLEDADLVVRVDLAVFGLRFPEKLLGCAVSADERAAVERELADGRYRADRHRGG